MFDAILYNSYPRRWRIILRGLTFTSLLLVVFFMASLIYLAARGESVLPTYLMFVFLVPGYAAHLLRAALSQNGADANNTTLATMTLICAIMVFSAFGLTFEHFKQIERKADIRWAISKTCSTDGEFRSEILSECSGLASRFRIGICRLGADPMNPCELRLRERLDRPLESDRQLLIVE